MFVVIEKINLDSVESQEQIVDKFTLLSKYPDDVIAISSYIETLGNLKSLLETSGATDVLYLFKSGYVVAGTTEVIPYNEPTQSNAPDTTVYTVSHYELDIWGETTGTFFYTDYIDSRLAVESTIGWQFNGYQTGDVMAPVNTFDLAETTYSVL